MGDNIRGYRAQIPEPVRGSISPPEPVEPAESVWPQNRYYRAYCQEDDDARDAIMAKYGLHSKDEAVRLALRLAAGDAIQVKTNAPVAKRIVVKIKARQ